MSKFILYIGLLISTLLGACSYELKTDEKPVDLIPRDSFTRILNEVMIVESYVKHQQNNVEGYAETLPEAVDSIFKKYKIDSIRYRNSFNYYSTQQEQLIEMYTEIKDSLNHNKDD
ncbi:DUF4296 domain-containing protein [Brumimicrobium aurantiacum]|uniref:DUF4296 domain-containing protein n=1 Tax=Brumimicrobium aurantiacum TaxID=1737063 RepID=A0A3E1F0W6_9FLAO|nr:DUF4296 domain-containing protein [Brumimicrobium aurantiacum]RFC55383.1 DUF4296 domain-containing protein [Brumimicrobium aurantiacum]